jgi:hypothetical protein
MAILSLNGNFNYPVEIKQSLSVDGKSVFNDAIQQGSNNGNAAKYSFVTGDHCAADAEYSFSAGISSYAGPNAVYARVDGFQCSGYGAYSRSYGYNAMAESDRSFVWQGRQSDVPYSSKGTGTFCINPEYVADGGNSSIPVCGFYIGDYCITDYISSHSAMRILNNPNVGDGGFDAPQEFLDDVILSGPVSSNSQFEYTGDSLLIISGDARVYSNNTIDSDASIIEPYVASTQYARGVALSAITNVGKYYPMDNIESINFDEKKDFAVSLDFIRSYVASSVNDVETFYDNTSGGGSVSTREYALNLATSASTYILPNDNAFTGKNSFGMVEITGRNSLSLSNVASADFRNGTVFVKEPGSINETLEYVPATERFARGVATSAVDFILKNGNTYGNSSSNINTYVASSRFRGPATFYTSVSLDSAAVANFDGGTLYVKEPSPYSMVAREPSTTLFTRNTALSAVNMLLKDGGAFSNASTVTFNGKAIFNKSVDFASPNGVEVDVKTQDIKKSGSTLAASTKYVEDYITNTISTSAVSVRNLILNGNEISKTNNFTTFNDFRGGDILVNTVDDTKEYDHYAASCEFVKSKVGSISMFDLFEMKYMDYRLPDTSKWKMAGSFVTKASCPNAYAHIYNDIIGLTQRTETVSGVRIPYYLASDGHKIVMSSNKGFLDTLFSRIGIAWYYILDTTPRSERIWLPRSTYNFNISTSDVGAYIEPTLPTHTHSVSVPRSADGSHGDGSAAHHGGSSHCSSISLDTSGPSSNVYKSGATVQPPATKMFLYFYCG